MRRCRRRARERRAEATDAADVDVVRRRPRRRERGRRRAGDAGAWPRAATGALGRDPELDRAAARVRLERPDAGAVHVLRVDGRRRGREAGVVRVGVEAAGSGRRVDRDGTTPAEVDGRCGDRARRPLDVDDDLRVRPVEHPERDDLDRVADAVRLPAGRLAEALGEPGVHHVEVEVGEAALSRRREDRARLAPLEHEGGVVPEGDVEGRVGAAGDRDDVVRRQPAPRERAGASVRSATGAVRDDPRCVPLRLVAGRGVHRNPRHGRDVLARHRGEPLLEGGLRVERDVLGDHVDAGRDEVVERGHVPGDAVPGAVEREPAPGAMSWTISSIAVPSSPAPALITLTPARQIAAHALRRRDRRDAVRDDADGDARAVDPARLHVVCAVERDALAQVRSDVDLSRHRRRHGGDPVERRDVVQPVVRDGRRDDAVRRLAAPRRDRTTRRRSSPRTGGVAPAPSCRPAPSPRS